MAGKSRRSKLVLTDEDRAELEQLSRSRTLPHREAQRATIILGYYGGESIASIGRRLGMTRLSVSKWVAKALAVAPMAALKDSYHRPKEPAIGDDAKAWVVHVACSKPKDLGYAAEVWSRQALARHIREHAVEAGFPALAQAAKATVHRILAEQPLHPEKVKYYLERRDPEFDAKMRRVLIVYQDVALQNARRAAGETASHVITVSVDEKPGVQAIGNTAPDLPPVPGKHPKISRDHEYERFGTCSILAALDLQDGASAESLVFVIAADFGMLAWYGRQIGCGIADGLDSGLLIHRNGDHVGGRLASGSSCILQRHILIYDQDPAHFRVKFRVAPFQVVLDLFRMEWLFRQDSMHGRLGSLRQRRKTGLHGMLADVPCQRLPTPNFGRIA